VKGIQENWKWGYSQLQKWVNGKNLYKNPSLGLNFPFKKTYFKNFRKIKF